MRMLTFILTVCVVFFLSQAVAIFMFPEYRQTLRGILGVQKETTFASTTYQIDETKKEIQPLQTGVSQELEKSINRLASGLELLSVWNTWSIQWTSVQPLVLQTGATFSLETIKVPEKKSLDLPLFIEAKLFPEYSLKVFESKSPFNISVFSKMEYKTYRDMNKNIRVYVFADSYATLLSQFRLVTNTYTVKEVDTFFEKSFFLNTVKKTDGVIRFVFLEKSWVYGFEVPKNQYPKLKSYLLSK